MERIFEHNHIQFNYLDQGTGQAFVFLHGLGASIIQAKELCNGMKGHRIVSMDFRGHGKSKRFITESDAQMKVFESDIQNLLAHLEIEKFFLGGLSLGAAISTRLALSQPEKIKKLVLIRPAWIHEKDPAHFEPLKLIHDLIQKYGLAAGREYFRESLLFQGLVQTDPGYADSLLGHFIRPQAGTSYALLKHIPEDRPFEDCKTLAQLTMPSLVIGSDDDPLHPFSYAQTYQTHLGSARLEKVSSKYLDAERHNREVRKLVHDFLAQ
ncbi:hydrolase, alpha/beta fold family [Lunatimonas lonarensis]|uniref:Hydrolase, alpha/beta fold family n=1 Tax=Lunatimonas lonarensis TaxID=1232681 RepID=R7ZVW5_9BACT|nr:alpha/beta hydrolase [Lunatimonas lonarensis]EON78153.1 hydrolase, alpha/beta fold family [Lunatimonas lonarensis]